MVDVDLPAATAVFLLAELGPAPKRVLEVGCGSGEVAACLQAAGHRVVGVDADASAIRSACARGLDARQTAWPDFHDTARYEAIVFTRSLHHLQPLDACVKHAASLLSEQGLALVEDFAFSDATPKTIAWFYNLLLMANARGWFDLSTGANCFAGRLLADGASAWQHDHVSGIHSAGAMAAALRRWLTIERVDVAPYLFRYVETLLGNGPVAADHLRWVFAEEQRAVADGRAEFIGRRFVCRAFLHA
jgi:SAM-dependent methyltransferase